MEKQQSREVAIIRDLDAIKLNGANDKANRLDIDRAYYRIRGPRITEQQAFEVIRRTDEIFGPLFKRDKAHNFLDYIWSWNFNNVWFSKDRYPSPYGWCHPNGIIGINDITGPYVETNDIVDELKKFVEAFPFIDMVIAVTDFDIMPSYAWNKLFELKTHKVHKEVFYMDYPDFIEHIKLGFWVHNSTIEIMNERRAKKVYIEYEAKYSEPNPDIYVTHYYMDNNIFLANYDYLCRLVTAYGLDPKEQLKGYLWKGWLNGDPGWREKLYATV